MYPSAGFTREVNAPLVLSESVTVPAGTDCYGAYVNLAAIPWLYLTRVVFASGAWGGGLGGGGKSCIFRRHMCFVVLLV